jgi:hypothetical protein
MGDQFGNGHLRLILKINLIMEIKSPFDDGQSETNIKYPCDNGHLKLILRINL